MILLWVALSSVILFSIPMFIPTWKWYWVSAGIIGLPLLVLWGHHFYAISQPEHQGSPGEGLGIFIIGLPTIAFLLGMFSRYCKWVIQLKLRELKSRSEK